PLYAQATTIGNGLTVSAGGATITGGLTLPGLNTLGLSDVLTYDTGTGAVGYTTDPYISSLRYKNDVKDVGNRSADLMKLRPVSFTYKNDDQKKVTFGLIAEEVQEVFPEVVGLKGDLPHKINYHQLTPLLVNEYQRHEQSLNSMAEQVRGLDEQHQLYEARLNNFEQELAELRQEIKAFRSIATTRGK
ncbi:hypothetical protein EBZ39_19290, partial [bacterium]|nr:hypothetical protein [bacterium]